MKNCLGFDQNSHIFYDKCSLDYRDKMSQQAGLYHLQTPSETRSTDAGITRSLSFSTGVLELSEQAVARKTVTIINVAKNDFKMRLNN